MIPSGKLHVCTYESRNSRKKVKTVKHITFVNHIQVPKYLKSKLKKGKFDLHTEGH